nr:hypothetical protein [Tanacetum cinerariifolium]
MLRLKLRKQLGITVVTTHGLRDHVNLLLELLVASFELIDIKSVIALRHKDIKEILAPSRQNHTDTGNVTALLAPVNHGHDLIISVGHVDKDLGVNASSELFALACGPTRTLISVNSCVVNGVSLSCTAAMNVAQLKTTTFVRLVKTEKYIIDVDEDNDIIDDEDVLPYDLAYYNDEDLVNVDDDDGMSADVSKGHGGDDGSDDRPPPHESAEGCRGSGKGTSQIWEAGKPTECIPHPVGADGGGPRKD